MLINDAQIRKLCKPPFHSPYGEMQNLEFPMIEPFSEAVSGSGIISYGLTSAGYDLRLAPDFLLFDPYSDEEIDPKRFGDEDYRSNIFRDSVRIHEQYGLKSGMYIVLPAMSYVLGRSYEYLRIPRCLKARCVGKSTLARCGILINTTPLEPEWEGHLTIEIGNVSPRPARVYIMEGIAQLEFETVSCGGPEKSYKDKGGKYQGQQGVTPARV